MSVYVVSKHMGWGLRIAYLLCIEPNDESVPSFWWLAFVLLPRPRQSRIDVVRRGPQVETKLMRGRFDQTSFSTFKLCTPWASSGWPEKVVSDVSLFDFAIPQSLLDREPCPAGGRFGLSDLRTLLLQDEELCKFPQVPLMIEPWCHFLPHPSSSP